MLRGARGQLLSRGGGFLREGGRFPQPLFERLCALRGLGQPERYCSVVRSCVTGPPVRAAPSRSSLHSAARRARSLPALDELRRASAQFAAQLRLLLERDAFALAFERLRCSALLRGQLLRAAAASCAGATVSATLVSSNWALICVPACSSCAVSLLALRNSSACVSISRRAAASSVAKGGTACTFLFECLTMFRRARGQLSPRSGGFLRERDRFLVAPVRAIVRTRGFRLFELLRFVARLAYLRRLRLDLALSRREFVCERGTTLHAPLRALDDVASCLRSALVARRRLPARGRPFSDAPGRAIGALTASACLSWPLSSSLALRNCAACASISR